MHREGVSLRVDLVCKPTPELYALNKGNCSRVDLVCKPTLKSDTLRKGKSTKSRFDVEVSTQVRYSSHP